MHCPYCGAAATKVPFTDMFTGCELMVCYVHDGDVKYTGIFEYICSSNPNHFFYILEGEE